MKSRTRRMENAANGGGCRRVKLPPPPGKRPEAWRSWYGSAMETRPLSQITGEPVRCPRRPAVAPDDGLYRYQPVPPVCRDEDGYLLEDGMSQTDGHLRQTTLWYHALKRRLPTATVCSDLPLHYRLGDTDKTLVPDLFVALRAPRLEGRSSYKVWGTPASRRALPTGLRGRRRPAAERGAGPRPAYARRRTALVGSGGRSRLEDLRRSRARADAAERELARVRVARRRFRPRPPPECWIGASPAGRGAACRAASAAVPALGRVRQRRSFGHGGALRRRRLHIRVQAGERRAARAGARAGEGEGPNEETDAVWERGRSRGRRRRATPRSTGAGTGPST